MSLLKISFFFAFLIVFASCGSDNTGETNCDDLENMKALVTNLNVDLDSVNAALESSEALSTLLNSGESMGKTEIFDRVKATVGHLEEGLERIEKLEEELEDSEVNNSFLKKQLAEAKTKLQSERERYQAIADREGEFSGQDNVDLKKVLGEKEKIIRQLRSNSKKDQAEIARLEEMREELNSDLVKKKKELRQAGEELEETRKKMKREQSKSYYEIGKQLVSDFDALNKKRITLGTKETKTALLENAKSYFERALSLGNKQAQYQLNKLKGEPYSKFLK